MQSISDFWNNKCIDFSKKVCIHFARFSLFVVYFWFGILKIVTESPANPLVSDLLGKTMPFMGFDTFIVLLGLFEVVLGISFLFPKLIKLSIVMLVIHMFTTLMPLIMLPEVTWASAFVPTLEGQYIIKNLLIISAALAIVASINKSETNHE